MKNWRETLVKISILLALLFICESNIREYETVQYQAFGDAIYHQANRKVAVLVEPLHKLEAIKFVLENAADMLPEDWKIIAMLPASAAQFVSTMCAESKILKGACETKRFRFIPLPESDWYDRHLYEGQHWRNKLFTDPSWWQKLSADWVLTLQADTIICRRGGPSLRYNFLAGPSFENQVYRYHVNMEYEGHLNGGFSVRNVAWVIDCLERFTMELSEDVIFSKCNRRSKKKPSFREAMLFASDNGWTGCTSYSECPFGLHKPWRASGLSPNELEVMLESCKGARKLHQLNGIVI